VNYHPPRRFLKDDLRAPPLGDRIDAWNRPGLVHTSLAFPLRRNRTNQRRTFMSIMTPQIRTGAPRGFTLAEVLIALALVGMMIGGIITSYLAVAYRGEWASASSAAHRLSVMKLEQLKAAPWGDLMELARNNPAGRRTSLGHMDLPLSVPGPFAATVEFWAEAVPEGNPDPDLLKLTVQCVWSLGSRTYTNPNPALVTYRGRD
jgi:prepilin-type N-terminal cleavage/methylation domain-containing protein